MYCVYVEVEAETKAQAIRLGADVYRQSDFPSQMFADEPSEPTEVVLLGEDGDPI
jgi:hypothetical protein